MLGQLASFAASALCCRRFWADMVWFVAAVGPSAASSSFVLLMLGYVLVLGCFAAVSAAALVLAVCGGNCRFFLWLVPSFIGWGFVVVLLRCAGLLRCVSCCWAVSLWASWGAVSVLLLFVSFC